MWAIIILVSKLTHTSLRICNVAGINDHNSNNKIFYYIKLTISELKDEKEEQKRKEREEKDEQKKKEKEARDEEKRKKQEALELEKQEQEQKKKKAAEAFVNFFVPKQKTEKDQATVGLSKNEMLSNFTIKADMRLAPAVRNPLTEERRKALDQFLECQVDDSLYIKSLKNGYKPLVGQKTWPLSDKDDDVVIVGELVQSNRW